MGLGLDLAFDEREEVAVLSAEVWNEMNQSRGGAHLAAVSAAAV